MAAMAYQLGVTMAIFVGYCIWRIHEAYQAGVAYVVMAPQLASWLMAMYIISGVIFNERNRQYNIGESGSAQHAKWRSWREIINGGGVIIS
jgi:O-antigen/teichoic acid export membrane protein